MRRLTTLALAVGILGAFAFVNPATSGPAFNNKYPSTGASDDCEDGQGNVIGTITYDGPLFMWPPNHKEQPISVTAADVDAPDDDNDMIMLSVEVTSDEDADMNGSGNTPVDSNIADATGGEDSVTLDGWLRSERSGQGDGRTYTLNYQSEFTDGEQDMEGYGEVACAGSFEVKVPHDQRGGAGWKHDTDGDGQGDNGKHGDD